MIKLIRCLLALALTAATSFAMAQTAPYAGLVISQVYGAGGNQGSKLSSDFIELFNRGNTAINLSGASVQYASSNGTSWSVNALPAVNLAPGQYFLIQESTGTGTSLPTADLVGSPSINMSGTSGKVALVAGTTSLNPSNGLPNARVIDFIGYGAAATTTEGGTTTANLTATTAAIRNANGCTDTDNNGQDFTVATANPRNTSTTRAPCSNFNAPIVTSCPAAFTTIAGSNGMASASASDADGTVNGVTLTTQTAGITLGTFSPATAAGGSATVPVQVANTVTPGGYSATLNWSNDQSQVAMCTIAVNVANLTPIYSIQGSGAASPLVGQSVITQGVVTRVAYNGFYIQDAAGDGNAATSDGIFVFTTSATPANVKVGDLARVSATVQEFNSGLSTNADTSAHTTTELATPTVTVVDTGYSIAPVAVTFPPANRDDLEKYEGMVVTFNGPFTVTGNDDEGTFGALTLAAQGRVENPTNRYRPGSSAQALNDANRLRTILLNDSVLSNPNPTPYLSPTDHTLRVGDTTPSLTGVLSYGLIEGDNTQPGNWLIAPTVEPTFTRVNQRTTAPDDTGGTIKVGSANIENFFTTFTNGQTADGQTGQGCTVGTSTSASNCRGASNNDEFLRQRAKVVAELVGMGADVYGLMEVQNNGSTTISNLVNALNTALGSTVYAAVADPAQGTGTDAIKVAMIYKPAKLTPAGASVSDTNPIHNRPPLAQTFTVAGTSTTFTLVVNHLRSKGCSVTTGPDSDQGDLQGCYNNTRLQQAQATRQFVASLFPAGPLPNVMLVGDFNSYAMEDPIADLTSNGYIDEIARFNTFGYSYQFAGQSGRLDQALTSPTLSSKVKRAVEWHINSDEPDVLNYNLENKQPACATCSPDYYTATPYRASDHDPIVIGISFGTTAPPPKGK